MGDVCDNAGKWHVNAYAPRSRYHYQSTILIEVLTKLNSEKGLPTRITSELRSGTSEINYNSISSGQSEQLSNILWPSNSMGGTGNALKVAEHFMKGLQNVKRKRCEERRQAFSRHVAVFNSDSESEHGGNNNSAGPEVDEVDFSRRRMLMHRLDRLSQGNSFDLDSPLQAEDGLAKRE